MRAPKVYVRDSGVVHALLSLLTYDELLSHPVVGGSWEGFVIENLLNVAGPWVEAIGLVELCRELAALAA